MTDQKKPNYLFPLIVMASLFFLFGFITTMNNSLIEFLSKAFKINGESLSNVQKQLPNTFFYGAYILSIPVGYLLNRIGYKKGVLAGLALICLGFFLCIPAVAMGYYGFLSAVSIFAIGVVLLQVAANPYVNALGSPETAASRLTLTNALNSCATVIAPMFVSMLIVSGGTDPKSVQGPFAGIAIVTLVIVVIMFFLSLPEIKGDETSDTAVANKKSSAYKFPHLWLGSLAIFFYLGVEIGIPSFFADYSTKLGFNFDSNTKTDLLKYYWLGLMVGRILGIFILRKFSARTILSFCALAAAVTLAISLILGGMGASGTLATVALVLFLGTGLFHSIMWPCIYNLALEDLGPHAKVGSGVIATSVIGAALLPPLMGVVQSSSVTIGLTLAISCLFVYYGYITFFAVKGSKIR